MPGVSAAAAIAEMSYLEKVAVEVDKDRLEKRVSPVFDVFTQQLSEWRRQKTLGKVLNSTYVIDDKYADYTIFDSFMGCVGLGRNPSAYKRVIGAIEVDKSRFDEKGYLDWALVLMLGDRGIFNRIINHYKIAADAVAAFYLDRFSKCGLSEEKDGRRLFVAKHLIPIECQGEGTRKLAYRLGNQAKQMEDEKQGTGLQHIYELTK